MSDISHSIENQSTERNHVDSLLFLNSQKNSFVTLIEDPFTQSSWLKTEIKEQVQTLPFHPLEKTSTSLLFFSYLFILISWVYYYQKHQKGLRSIISSFFNSSTLFHELNDKSGANGFVSLGMFLLGIITLSIFAFQMLTSYSLSLFYFDFLKSNLAILFILSAIILGLFLKTMLILLSGLVFNALKTLQAYLSLIIISIQITGIILFPIIVISTYGNSINSDIIVYTGAFAIGSIFIYRLIRSFFLGVKQTNSQVFHIILYICALEILPLILFGRILIDNN